MDINILEYDSVQDEYVRIAIIDTYSSLIWCKRYFDIGALDLQIEATTETINLLQKGRYITRNDDETIYVIQNIEISTEANKDNSLLVGAVDCKSILGQRIIWNQTVVNNITVENYIRQLINENVINPVNVDRKINHFVLNTAKGYTERITQQATYEQLDEKIISLCKSNNYGWTIGFDTENKQFYFDLYKGVDRSQGQQLVPMVAFSPEYDNLISSKYTKDSSDFKNVALIGGEGEGVSRTTTTYGSATGMNRFEMFVDAKSDSTNSGTVISPQEYNQQLQTKGKEALSNKVDKTSFEGSVVSDSYIYKTDYNLGDIVTLKNEYGIMSNARIVEIIEVWNNEGYSLEPKFEYIQEE